jgi:hypothetical protein
MPSISTVTPTDALVRPSRSAFNENYALIRTHAKLADVKVFRRLDSCRTSRTPLMLFSNWLRENKLLLAGTVVKPDWR